RLRENNMHAYRATPRASRVHAIQIRHAREHNLKDVSLDIPHDALTVITGVSGSGKSTLAFDILFAEGQRRYLESLNAYARQFVQPAARPDVDAIEGVPPTVAIEQRTSRGGRNSTVATVTEIYHFLRLLYVRLGTQYCPDCKIPIQAQTQEAIVGDILKRYRGKRITLLAPLVVARKGYYTDLAKWASGKGVAHLCVDGAYLPTNDWPRLDRFTEHNIELPVAHRALAAGDARWLAQAVGQTLEQGHGMLYAAIETSARSRRGEPRIYSMLRACPGCARSFEDLDPRMFSYNSKHGWCPACFGTGLRLEGFDEEQTGEEIWWNDWFEGETQSCPACKGARLRAEALSVVFHKRNIADYMQCSVDALAVLFDELNLSGREAEISRDVLSELKSRLHFLSSVGLGYLTLDRGAPTLSGGEARRVRLAAQLGSNLRGVCYILDEPTIGLHPRDNLMLLDAIHELERKGNTVVVVEHDEETIRRAQHVIDLGPGGGVNGGHIVGRGTLADLMQNPKSTTGRMMKSPLQHPLVPPRPPVPARSPKEGPPVFLAVTGARLHNLKNVSARIPLGRLVCVTGVSGSGKSTLIHDIVYPNLKHRLAQTDRKRQQGWLGCREIVGFKGIQRIMEVDQTPIGKTPRSCPATYVGIWDDIRRIFANTAESRLRGYSASRFSFNVDQGRCPECQGQGMKKLEMSFLPDVTVICEVCQGRRFDPETLSVTFNGKTVADVLNMDIETAIDFFAAHPRLHRATSLLRDVGLGYLTLGQQSPTLSGGEAQRIKLVSELVKARAGAEVGMRGRASTAGSHCLYLLDEPTIGLHMADVEKLVRVLHRLVDAGHTVVVIEHNLDIIAEADWIIDLGPEGGAGGGRIVVQGPSAKVCTSNGHTGKHLRDFMASRPKTLVGAAESGDA
ncbi:MAG: excinuclease ABC subunit A, partial [Verrucomicrobia bacterium]|nr:excinuclease ABC subunit A [Verrucomicrobiota bacterium]